MHQLNTGKEYESTMSTGSPPGNVKVTRAFAILRWRVFSETYPRIAAGMALGIAILFLIDLALVCKRIEYGRELALLRASMSQAEVQRVDAIEASENNLMTMTVELARREALGNSELHLAVDSGKSLMYLEREGAVLREMPVRLAPEAIVGTSPDTVRLAPPRGKRFVVRVVNDTYRWAAPEWIFVHRGQPVPGDRMLSGALGPLAIILDSGVVIYSLPTAGPLSDASYVLPGSVRAEAADIEAIKANLQPGMAVYFL
jgi:hypothetical protein